MTKRAMKMPDLEQTVTWKWIVGVLISFMLMGAIPVWSVVGGQITDNKKEIDANKAKLNEMSITIGRMDERQKAMKSVLDEVLKAVQPHNGTGAGGGNRSGGNR